MPDVDEVDDVAEAEPVDQVADRAAEQQPERDRQVQAPAGPRVVADDQADDDERDDPEQRARCRGTGRTARRCSG